MSEGPGSVSLQRAMTGTWAAEGQAVGHPHIPPR